MCSWAPTIFTHDARMKRYPEAEDDGVVFVTNLPWARSVPQPLADIQAGEEAEPERLRGMLRRAR
jgi:hypothetical protein